MCFHACSPHAAATSASTGTMRRFIVFPRASVMFIHSRISLLCSGELQVLLQMLVDTMRLCTSNHFLPDVVLFLPLQLQRSIVASIGVFQGRSSCGLLQQTAIHGSFGSLPRCNLQMGHADLSAHFPLVLARSTPPVAFGSLCWSLLYVLFCVDYCKSPFPLLPLQLLRKKIIIIRNGHFYNQMENCPSF